MTTFVAAIQHGLGVDDDDDNDDDADHDTNECDDIILKNIPEQASTRPRISWCLGRLTVKYCDYKYNYILIINFKKRDDDDDDDARDKSI